MTETLDVIKSRYSCRRYADRPVDPQVLRQIAEAAVMAPSAVNRQFWRIIVITDPALLLEMNDVGMVKLKDCDPAGYERIMSRGGRFFYDAPAVVFIAAQPSKDSFPTELDTGIVASHIVLAAASLGVNSCITAMSGALFREPDGDAWEKRLGFPEGYHFGLGILLGYEGETPRAPHTPDFDKISMITG
ncbi:MAG: nitroreductase family protein [Propionibacteriaceae bacterium]|jgi:nitroreductase|nr:nitroreductase family protein [Propionibacteriaceae bacterium]